MKINTEPLPNCQMALIIEPDAQSVQKALRQAARKLSRRRNIPGFRPGKAPYMAAVRVFGKEALYEQVVEDMGDQFYKEALEESGLQPIAPGVLDEVTYDPLVLRLTLPMPPAVDLGDYRSLRVEHTAVEVSDEEVDEQLSALHKSYSEWGPVEEGAVFGDLITMSLSGVTGDETIIKDDAFEIVLDAEGEAFPPGFDQQFVGRQAGDSLAFDLTYPEDWPSGRAGKQVHFQVEVHGVKRHDEPALDDSFAPLVGNYDTLDELKESIRQSIANQRQAATDNEYVNQALEKVIENASQIDYPPILLEEGLDRLEKEQEREMERTGIPFDEFLRMTNQTRESNRERLREVAERRLVGDLALEQLAQLEGLAASDEEIDEHLGVMLAAGGAEAESMRGVLQSTGGRAVIARDVVRSKTIQRLMEIARGVAPQLAPPEQPESQAETAEDGAPVVQAQEEQEETVQPAAAAEPASPSP